MAKENRKHKDSVFTDLFTNDETARKNVLELYNALFDTGYTDEEIIKFDTLITLYEEKIKEKMERQRKKQ